MSKKFIYFFGRGKAEGKATMKDLLGGKGANLAEMSNLGIPVPAGFTITTEVCNYYDNNKKQLPTEFPDQLKKMIERLEKTTGKFLGNDRNPLLVSVRSGAKFSMPGMMDTILNLGLNDKVAEGLANLTQNPRFAYDAYRRFIQMFGNVVLEIDKDKFEHILEKIKNQAKIKLDTELKVDDLKKIIKEYKKLIKKEKKIDFPQNPFKQLEMAYKAVFASWNNDRAITYRRLNNIDHNLGTAVNVQAMVFGNMGNDSATGVGFTRNPSTGEDKFYGEFLVNAQGEDVVAGIRTPQPIEKLGDIMPEAFNQLREITHKLEKHYRDIQDFEFTIENKELFMLQTRTGKRTAQAAVKIAIDLVSEKLISKDEALMRVEPQHLDQLLHPIIDPKAEVKIIARGLPASPGAAVGKVVFDADTAQKLGEKEKVILVRAETSPDDIHGMNAAQGILTSRGGMTSHAAVVARGMGKTCIAGCEEIKIDAKKKVFTAAGKTVKEGDFITLNGSTGEVILGQVSTIEPKVAGEFRTLMSWVDKIRKLGVRTNADTPNDAKTAREFGAEGIGLCRTEHMFFDAKRLPYMQKMILADTLEDRQVALKKLLPFQKDDFKELFRAMKGLPVTIRTLDPPLHEFLPKNKVEAQILSKKIGISVPKIEQKTRDLHEFNPMLGHRGCRLGITYPEITAMQTEAIISAACELKKENIRVIPEIMIPLVGNVKELENQKQVVVETATLVMEKYKVKVDYKVGTMIEVPRAAITADEIAEVAEFFSFGTNDLTQMTMGFSRDDAGKFIKAYQEKGIFDADPFQTLDQEGVGELVKIGIEKGRSVKKDLKVGICGEHGGDPKTIHFCHQVKMDYVSCSPYRVPVARLAAAQA
ncbi:MAG: pyruvate, phosphate dikinase, partial [Patescibacteria group bacterium]|nr:pyruvate, phosphate dikinase [Patescibacteria group bacterium]